MRHCVTALASAAIVLAVGVESGASVLSDWNLVSAGSVTTTSEVDGSALVGGSILGTSNYSTHLVTAPNGDGLAVGGDIGAGISVQINNGGNLRISGNVLGAVNFNGGSQINDPNVASMVSAAMTEAVGLSTYFSGLANNGSVDGAGNMSAVPTLIGADLVAVYTITQAAFNSLGQLNLSMGGATSIVINFIAGPGGVADLISPPNLVGDFNQANSDRILWNFGSATTLLVNNNLNGAVLATSADLQLLGGGINGSVVVDHVSIMNAEIRESNYGGHLPSPGPLVLAAAPMLWAARRRR